MIDVLLSPFRIVADVIGGAVRRPSRLVVVGAGIAVALICVGLAATLTGLPVTSVQLGFRGVGMVQQYADGRMHDEIALNRVDVPFPAAVPSGHKASEVFQNIKVLGDADSNDMLRLMAAMSNWVAPSLGCSYCHSTVNMADDTLYTKRVTRHMIEMTRYINTNWRSHVGNAGVTCNTCHRGNGIPKNTWQIAPTPGGVHTLAETGSGMDVPSKAAGLTSYPADPYTAFFLNADPIRIQPLTALPTGADRASIGGTDWTYALMIHFADSLGVGCNFCHNSRAFSEWDQGTPNRLVAWYGIQMVRDLNSAFMVPITDLFPRGRRGAFGDVAKIDCATCHQGAYKPFYGASSLAGYPILNGPAPTRAAALAGALQPIATAPEPMPGVTPAGMPGGALPAATTLGGAR